MNSLVNAWIVLEIINKLVLPFGLSLPLKLKNQTTWTLQQHRRIKGLVLFFIICSSSFCSWEFYRTNNVKVIPSFVLTSSTFCFIVGRKYARLEDISTALTILLGLTHPQASLNNSMEHNSAVSTLKNNWILLLKVTPLLVIVSLKIYLVQDGITFPAVFQTVLDLFLMGECFLITSLLDITLKLIEFIEASTTHLYSEFYKCPAAEMKKTENGDLVLLGWMSESLAQRKSRAEAQLLEDKLFTLVELADVSDAFNRIFAPVISAVFLICFVGAVEGICEIVTHKKGFSEYLSVDVAMMLYFWCCLCCIFWKCGNIGDSMRSLANVSFKLYADIPATVFLEEEVEFKNNLYLIYNLAMDEGWTIFLFEAIPINPQIYIKILTSILMLYFVFSVVH